MFANSIGNGWGILKKMINNITKMVWDISLFGIFLSIGYSIKSNGIPKSLNVSQLNGDTNINLSALNASNSFTLSFKDKFDLFFKSLILTSTSYNQIRDKYKDL